MFKSRDRVLDEELIDIDFLCDFGQVHVLSGPQFPYL